jgi:flagella basal body P-ring formation protein FlgA
MTGLEASLADFVAQRCGASRVEVVSVGILERAVPAGEPRWSGDPCRRSPTLTLTAGVSSVMVRPRYDAWAEVLLADGDIEEGAPLRAKAGEVLIGTLVGRPLRDVAGWVARGPIHGGRPLTDAVVRTAPDAVAGAEVTLVVRSGALVITAPGTLLTDGKVGETVRVVNRATRAGLSGVLVSADRVELGGGS